MTTDAITYCQKFLTHLAKQDGVASVAMDDADLQRYKIACVRADYLQEVVDTARRTAEIEVKLYDYQTMVNSQSETIIALKEKIRGLEDYKFRYESVSK